jgi:hypothetical protein
MAYTQASSPAFDQFIDFGKDGPFDPPSNMDSFDLTPTAAFTHFEYPFDGQSYRFSSQHQQQQQQQQQQLQQQQQQLQQQQPQPQPLNFTPPYELKPMSVLPEPMTIDWSKLALNRSKEPGVSLHKLETQKTTSQIKYGQTTPPDTSTSPFGFDQHDVLDRSMNTHYQVPSSPMELEPANEEQAIQPKKRTRRTRKKREPDAHCLGEVEKRSKFLERNRVAASKCRQKKKEWATNLDSKARELQMNKDSLSVLANSLKEEVLYLKGEMLRHSGCNCPEIKAYLQNQIGKLAGNTRECTHCKRKQDHHKHSPSKEAGHRRDSVRSNSTAFSPTSSTMATPMDIEDSTSTADSQIESDSGSPAEDSLTDGSPDFSNAHLEALLVGELQHDTSYSGIESKLRKSLR